MLARISYALVVGFLVTFVGTAHAGSVPYADWAFDVSRASDDAAFEQLVKSRPEFAKVYFFGQVFDLVTDGIPDKTKAQIKPRLAAIAAILKAADSRDDLPALYMDRLANGTLASEAEPNRQAQQKTLDALNGRRDLAVRLSTVENPRRMLAVFYALLYRAELSRPRLGGREQVRTFLKATRLLAEGFALLDGDFGAWKALAHYHPKAGVDGLAVDIKVDGVVEQSLVAALNRRLNQSPVNALAAMQKTLGTARSARGDNLLVALIMNGTAHAATAAGQPQAARNLHQQVLQGVRQLGMPVMSTMLAAQIVKTHLADKTYDAMRAVTRVLRTSPKAALKRKYVLGSLELAADSLARVARTLSEEGKLALTLTVTDEATSLYTLLSDDELASVGRMKDEVQGILYQRLEQVAQLHRLRGEVELRRGNLESAKVSLMRSADVFEKRLNDLVGAAQSRFTQASANLAQGDWKTALATTKSVLAALGPEGDSATRARGYLIQGWIRYALGQLAKAYGNANHGLRVLKGAQDPATIQATRGRLHALAAAVLDGAGFAGDAAARVAYALKYQPQDPEIVRMAVSSMIEGGDLEGALAAIEPLMDSEFAQIATVWRGCILVRSGQMQEGVTMLELLIPQLSLPYLNHANMVGRTCLAFGQLKQGDESGAQKTIASALRRLEKYPHAGLAWRLHILDGEVAARSGRVLEAAGSLRQGLDAFLLNLGERAWRGVSVSYKTLALPAEPMTYLRRLPDLLARAAAKDKGARAIHSMAAIKVAEWLRRWATAPSQRAFDPDEVAEVTSAVHSQLARLDGLRQILSDSAVSQRQRASIEQKYRIQVEAFRESVAAVRGANASLYDFYAPQQKAIELSPDSAHLIYRVQDDATHLWLVLSTSDVRHYMLPGRQKIAAFVDDVLSTVTAPPQPWDTESKKPKDPNAAAWDDLARAATALMPFTKNRRLMSSIEGRRLLITADGPLMRLPFDALVLKAPSRKEPGRPPVFAGTAMNIRLVFPDQVQGTFKQAGTSAVIGPMKGVEAACSGRGEGGDACKAKRGASLVAALTPALTNGEGGIRLDGPTVSKQAFGTALAGKLSGLILSPTDFSSASFLLGGEDGSLEFNELATLGIAKELFVLSPLFDPTPAETGLAIRQLQSVAIASGAEAIAINLRSAADDGDALAWIAPYLAGDRSIQDAIFSWKRFAMTQPFVPAESATQLHHPYYWARWQVFAAAGKQPKVIEPISSTMTEDNPYAEDAAETAPKTPDASATTDAVSKPQPEAVDPSAPAQPEQGDSEAGAPVADESADVSEVEVKEKTAPVPSKDAGVDQKKGAAEAEAKRESKETAAQTSQPTEPDAEKKAAEADAAGSEATESE